jgi:hypothetical protein
MIEFNGAEFRAWITQTACCPKLAVVLLFPVLGDKGVGLRTFNADNTFIM